MTVPDPTYETYANHPSEAGPTELRVKFFRPSEEECDDPDSLPLLIWFHAGSFHAGDIEVKRHERIARNMNKRGYACAIVQYRLGGREQDLTSAAQDILPLLMADAELRASDIDKNFVGAKAMAAMEDGAAFLSWLEKNREVQGFSGHYILGGASSGAVTVLNLLHIAPRLGYVLPDIQTAIVLSGAFAYPSFYKPNSIRTLAISGANEFQLPVSSIRAYAYLSGDSCVLLEHGDHIHGDPRSTRDEILRHAMRRFVDFDKGADIKSERLDRPDRKTKRNNRFCLFTSVRNEGPFLLEWIAHNRSIGVTDFVIFSNDCDDGTTELLDALDNRGIIKHVPNPSKVLGSDQHLDLAVHCAKYTKEFLRSDYAILANVDEFIQINVADGTLNGLLAATGYPDVISLTELLYGFGGVEKFYNRLVSSQFRVSDILVPEMGNPQRRVKSIMRVSKAIATYSNHRPQINPDAIEGLDWIDGGGRPVPSSFVTNDRQGLEINKRYALARVNHYTLRSAESMLVKFAQGDAAHPESMRKEYFQDRNGSAIRNEDFLPFLPRIKVELGNLLKDPMLLKLHKSSVSRHKAKIQALKENPEYAEVWATILEEVNQPVESEVSQEAAE